MRLARAAALFVIFCWVWIALPATLAQILLGSLVVGLHARPERDARSRGSRKAAGRCHHRRGAGRWSARGCALAAAASPLAGTAPDPDYSRWWISTSRSSR